MDSTKFTTCVPCLNTDVNESIRVFDKVYEHVAKLHFWVGPDKNEIRESIENIYNVINELNRRVKNMN